ncbi:MAG TPA: tetratricopeptide repeat protein [Candidatus Kapabacteria bacterium]|nr:tetratricopeptide repeat protein [Candidatus Kapabacteria bacterium]
MAKLTKSDAIGKPAVATGQNGLGNHHADSVAHPSHPNGNGADKKETPQNGHTPDNPQAKQPARKKLDETVLVGREKEIASLDVIYANMLRSKGGVLFVTGEAGLGKTTLIHEWWKDTAIGALTGSNPYPIFAESACSTPTGNMELPDQGAFQPWGEIVRQIQKIAATAKVKQKVELKKIIYESAPAWAWALPVVGGIAHAAVETSRLIRKQREGLDINLNANDQQQIYQQYVNLLCKIAEDHPLVIMLDDVHWVDRASVNLLFYLARQIADRNILIICTYRPEDASLSTGGVRHPVLTVKNEIIRYGLGTELPLTQLDEGAIRQLLGRLFPKYKTDKTFERWLRKKSDGNALFVTQFIKTLYEDELLDEHGAFTGTYKNVSAPVSALAVIEERMQRLPAETRKLLSYAAVEGEEFTSAVLSKLAKKNPAKLLDELQKAQRLGIIVSRGRSHGFLNMTSTIFSFSHSLLRTALYDKLLQEEKNLLHRECFTILKAEWDSVSATHERTPGLALKLMTHADICGEWSIAAETAILAAQGAWQIYSDEDAIELIANARRFNTLDTSDTNNERRDSINAEADLLDADIAIHGSRYDDALAICANALEYLEKRGDILKHINVLDLRAKIFYVQGIFDRSEQEARKALLAAEKAKSIELQAEIYKSLGKIRCSQGLYDESLAYHSRSMELRETLGDKTGIAESLNNIGTVYRAIGAYDEALANYKRSLEIFEFLNIRPFTGQLLLNIGELYAARGAYEEALTYLRRSLSIGESIGDRPAIAYSLDTIGSVYTALGSYDTAQAYHEKSLQIREAVGNRADIAASLHNIGLVYERLGSLTEALDFFSRSLEMREAIGDRAGIARSLHHVGNVYKALNSYSDALDFFERALDIRKNIGDRKGIAATLLNIGAVYTANGAYKNAIAYLTRALEMYENMNDHAGAAATLQVLGSLYRKKGEFEKARTSLDRANIIAERAKAKDIWGMTLCELGLLDESEASAAKDNHAGMMQRAIDRLERGVHILHDTRRADAGHYELELVRVKNAAR